jgi:hypothetical protein
VSIPVVEDEPEPGAVYEQGRRICKSNMNQSSYMSLGDYLLGMIVHTDPIESAKSMFSAVLILSRQLNNYHEFTTTTCNIVADT